MSEYQAILIHLAGRAREDEDTVTDALNDRCRSGWSLFQLLPLSPRRVLAIFQREG